jgi:hypothetical protein
MEYQKNAIRLGFYSAIVTVVLTIITFGIAIFTPPIAGANCVGSCIDYPYLDITSRFPRDYYWMYPAILLTLIYLVLMVCIHHYAAEGKKVFSQIAFSMALMATLTLVMNYFIQVSVIQPSLEHGETEGIALLTQYNSHGLFIVLEELGYILMNLSFLCIVPVFANATRVERSIRWIGVISFVLAVIGFAAVSMDRGINRQDRFEVIIISIDWLSLIILGVLISRVFKKLRTGSLAG